MKNFRVPDIPGIDGKVLISFWVEKNGNPERVQIIRSMGKAIDDEALRLMAECPLWIPGKKRGVPVAVLYTLPIAIRTSE